MLDIYAHGTHLRFLMTCVGKRELAMLVHETMQMSHAYLGPALCYIRYK
jgi:hypothetical protein